MLRGLGEKFTKAGFSLSPKNDRPELICFQWEIVFSIVRFSLGGKMRELYVSIRESENLDQEYISTVVAWLACTVYTNLTSDWLKKVFNWFKGRNPVKIRK